MNDIIDYEESISYAEVYDIIMFLEDDEKNKIPKEFIKYIKNNKLENYITKVNPYIPLELQKVRKQTTDIIAYLYRKYLADEIEKEKFRQQENEEYEEERKILEENYNKKFNKSKNLEIINQNSIEEKQKEISNLPMIKESFFEKIKNILKKLLKK